jgi:hypothetical protein
MFYLGPSRPFRAYVAAIAVLATNNTDRRRSIIDQSIRPVVSIIGLSLGRRGPIIVASILRFFALLPAFDPIRQLGGRSRGGRVILMKVP